MDIIKILTIEFGKAYLCEESLNLGFIILIIILQGQVPDKVI